MSRTSLISLILLLTISVSCQNFFWSHTKPSEDIYVVQYGLLYNWYAATDARKISSSDDWIVPSKANVDVLISYVGGTSVAGEKLKKTEMGGTNEYGFNGELAGIRQQTSYAFASILSFGYIVTSNSTLNLMRFSTTSESFWTVGGNKAQGTSVRLLYTGVGTPTSYIGNDGKIYRVVTIGTQTWLADNLCETKFRNGDVIPWYGANPVDFFTNVEWSVLTTAGCTAYNNDVNNVAAGFTFPTP